MNDLPQEARPFVAAIVLAHEPCTDQHRAYASQFAPELVARVHTAFAAHLYALTLETTEAKKVAAEYLEVVERAGLLEPAWCAVAYLRAAGQAGDAIRRASAPALH
jgi:hypothetical protein